MRVFRPAIVLGFLAAVCAPGAASAAPLLGGSLGGSCSAIAPTSPNCGLFSVDPLSPDALSGAFEFEDDVILFQFSLTSDTLFSVATSSFSATNSFDPQLGLFRRETLEFVTVADGGGGATPVRGVDINPDPANADYNDLIAPVLLGSGDYLLALLKYPNEFSSFPDGTGVDTLAAGFFLDGLTAPCAPAEGGCTFTLTFASTTLDDVEPIPEPATLTLMAGGAAAALIRRRRAKRASQPA